MRYVLAALFAGALAGWQPDSSPEAPAVSAPGPLPARAVDMHTSRNSLDWPGVYEGLLGCVDCDGFHTRLTLALDGRFAIVMWRLVRDAVPSFVRGQFDWEADGNTIVLTTDRGKQRLAVGEGRLLLLEAGQTQPAWDQPDHLLVQLSRTRPDLSDTLEDHRRRQVRDTGPNREIDGLFPDAQPSFVINFEGSQL
jgi:hypothetical protein